MGIKSAMFRQGSKQLTDIARPLTANNKVFYSALTFVNLINAFIQSAFRFYILAVYES